MFFKNYITPKNIIFLVLVLICIKFLSQIVNIALLFFASYVIACSINPLVDKMEKKMKRSKATILAISVISIVIFAFFVPILATAVSQIHLLVQNFPQRINDINAYIHNVSIFGHNIWDMVDLDKIAGSTTNVVSGVVNQSISATIGIGQFVVILLGVTTIVFYLVNDKCYIKEKFIQFFPEKMKTKAEHISDTISQKVGGYVIAQAISMIAVGLMLTLFLIILRVDYPLLLGLAAGILDIIPVLGPTIALIAVIVVAHQAGWLIIALSILAFLAVQQISNNLIRPVIFGKFLDLHPLVIIFALFVSAQFLGVWGVILAPAIAATICELLDELYLKPINKIKD